MTIDFEKLAFIDCETTGLNPELHEIWEVGLIVGEQEYAWMLPVNLKYADPIALSIGGFHERHPHGNNCGPNPEPLSPLPGTLAAIARMTHGRHLVGAIPSFDEERLRRAMLSFNLTPTWHYHIIDVEALAVGWLANARWGAYPPARDFMADPLPWDSRKVSAAVGVKPEDFRAHEALEDARWAKAIYEAVMGDGE